MIRTRSLTKDFVVSRSRAKHAVHAVRGIDLDVAPGELVAVLGPNGAGKTTTMRMLTTLIAPTSGTATVAGHDVVAEPAQVRRRIGYVGQGNGAGHSQRARDELVTQARIHGLDRRAAACRADELLETLGLTELAARKVSDLSGGQRRRLDVAIGLVHAPPLLFLDEPTTGLDPHNRANLWDHLGRMRAEREMTVLLTTHYLDEADAMAERVVVVDHGQIIADDTAEALKTDLAGDLVTVTTTDREAVAGLAAITARVTGADAVDTLGTRVQVRCADGTAALPAIVRVAAAAGVDVTGAHVERPTLDDVFLALTGRSLRETTTTEADDAAPTAPARGAAGATTEPTAEEVAA